MAREVRAPGSTGAITYPDPPSYLRGKGTGLAGALRVFGPGAIIASATIGSGEMIFAARGGAVFSYAIIWTLIIASLAKAALAYSANRYFVVTGEHPMTRWATLFPGPRGWFPLLIGAVSIASFPSWVGGLSVAIGNLMASITFGSGALWATTLVVLSMVLSWVGGYEKLEKAQTLIVGFMLIAVAVSMFVLNPDWLAALGGLVPTVPSYAPWLQQEYADIAARPVWLEIGAYLGAIGGGTYDYIGYTGMLREKRWGMLGHRDINAINDRLAALPGARRLPLSDAPQEALKARAWSRAPLGDVIVSFAAIGIFGIMFMINGATLLHEEQLVPEGTDTLTYQAQFLTAISPAFEYLYYLAVFFAFFGSLYAFWELYTYTAYETLGAVFPRVRRAGQRALRPWIYAYILICGLALVWTVGELVAIVTPASVLGGLLGSGVFCLAIVWTESQVLPPQYRLTPAGRWWVLISGGLLTLLGLISTWQLFV